MKLRKQKHYIYALQLKNFQFCCNWSFGDYFDPSQRQRLFCMWSPLLRSDLRRPRKALSRPVVSFSEADPGLGSHWPDALAYGLGLVVIRPEHPVMLFDSIRPIFDEAHMPKPMDANQFWDALKQLKDMGT